MLGTEIKIDQVEKTYRGKTGCACGCGGEYYYTGSSDEVATKEVIKHIKHINKNSERVTTWVGFSNQLILELENPSGTSVTRVYLKVNK